MLLWLALTRLLKAVQAANSEDTTPGPGAGAGADSQRGIASEPGFILAVDDLQENRELVARYLSRSGHIVVTAASGPEALATLGQTDVDVVLLDLMMPEMDGFTFMEELRARPGCRSIPVIVITAKHITLQERESLAVSTRAFLPTPVPRETIEQILNVFWNVEIHGSPSLCTSRGSLASTPPTALNTFQSRRSSTSRDPTNRLPHAARVY